MNLDAWLIDCEITIESWLVGGGMQVVNLVIRIPLEDRVTRGTPNGVWNLLI